MNPLCLTEDQKFKNAQLLSRYELPWVGTVYGRWVHDVMNRRYTRRCVCGTVHSVAESWLANRRSQVQFRCSCGRAYQI